MRVGEYMGSELMDTADFCHSKVNEATRGVVRARAPNAAGTETRVAPERLTSRESRSYR